MLCLNMIVRNEAANIERCLASVAPVIGAWVIGDTGSTDTTPELIQRFFAARGIPRRVAPVSVRRLRTGPQRGTGALPKDSPSYRCAEAARLSPCGRTTMWI